MKFIAAKNEGGYYFKSSSDNINSIIEIIAKNTKLQKNSFAERSIIKIFTNLLKGAINLNERYLKYYKWEYSSFEEFLYKKELMDKELIEIINIKDNETLWELRYKTNDYNGDNIFGFDKENLFLINGFLGEIDEN